jgi:hypothetical protein
MLPIPDTETSHRSIIYLKKISDSGNVLRLLNTQDYKHNVLLKYGWEMDIGMLCARILLVFAQICLHHLKSNVLFAEFRMIYNLRVALMLTFISQPERYEKAPDMKQSAP